MYEFNIELLLLFFDGERSCLNFGELVYHLKMENNEKTAMKKNKHTHVFFHQYKLALDKELLFCFKMVCLRFNSFR